MPLNECDLELETNKLYNRANKLEKAALPTRCYVQSKKESRNQELVQSSTTPDRGYQWKSDNFTIIRHHK